MGTRTHTMEGGEERGPRRKMSSIPCGVAREHGEKGLRAHECIVFTKSLDPESTALVNRWIKTLI